METSLPAIFKDPNLLSFSLLPVEIQLLIANELPYQGIINFCQTEKALVNLCNRPYFWEALVRHRYPGRDTQGIANPQEVFFLFETGYQVIVTNKKGLPLTFFTYREDEIAGALAGYSLTMGGFTQEGLVSITIYQPGGQVMTQEEMDDFLDDYEISTLGTSIREIAEEVEEPFYQLEVIGTSLRGFYYDPTGNLVKIARSVILHLGEKVDVTMIFYQEEGDLLYELPLGYS